MKDKNLQIAGVLELLSDEDLKIIGASESQYKFDKLIVFYKRKSLPAKYAQSKTGEIRYIYISTIKKEYSLEEGQEKYPELFI